MIASKVSDSALKDAQWIGLLGDRESRLLRMAQRSARFTHPKGNRRFHGFVLKIVDGVIQSVDKIPPIDCDRESQKIRLKKRKGRSR